jgi:hypothetical protein
VLTRLCHAALGSGLGRPPARAPPVLRGLTVACRPRAPAHPPPLGILWAAAVLAAAYSAQYPSFRGPRVQPPASHARRAATRQAQDPVRARWCQRDTRSFRVARPRRRAPLVRLARCQTARCVCRALSGRMHPAPGMQSAWPPRRGTSQRRMRHQRLRAAAGTTRSDLARALVWLVASAQRLPFLDPRQVPRAVRHVPRTPSAARSAPLRVSPAQALLSLLVPGRPRARRASPAPLVLPWLPRRRRAPPRVSHARHSPTLCRKTR